MTKPFIIAIDGASSTGKSTLAKGLADQLGFVHVDSGAMCIEQLHYMLKIMVC